MVGDRHICLLSFVTLNVSLSHMPMCMVLFFVTVVLVSKNLCSRKNCTMWGWVEERALTSIDFMVIQTAHSGISLFV